MEPKSSDLTDPEVGILTRCREWTDLFPWLRYGRLMRLVAAPSLTVMTALTLLIWQQGAVWLLDGAEVFNWPQQARVDTFSNFKVLSVVSEAAFKLHPASLFIGSEDHAFSLRLIAASLWTILIWIVPALVLIRQGIVLTAGRSLESFPLTVSIAKSRLLQAGSVMGSVLLGPLLIAFGIWLVSWFHQTLTSLNFLLGWPCAIVLFILSFAGGLLVLMSYFVIPLALAAITAEPHPDVFDAVSRGYESCLRRPLRLLSYLLVLTLLLFATFVISNALVSCSSSLLRLFMPTEHFAQEGNSFLVALRFLPSVFVITLAWGSMGTFYLLLRKDACEQEIEDIWFSSPAPTIALPKITVKDE